MAKTYDIVIDGQQYKLQDGTYQETGRTALLDRSDASTTTGEQDYGLGYAYAQRSWVLGEQQEFSHEWDEQKQSGPFRYYEGHGVDVSHDGKVSLLPALRQSLVTPANPTTCPMTVSYDGAYVYAFPATSTDMHIFNGTTWTTEAITGCVAPVTDCVTAGAALYVIDSNGAGSRVLKRSGGTWSRVTVPTAVASAWGATAYNTATAVIYTNGEIYVLSATMLYAHDAEQIISEWVGGTMGCAYAGAVFWSDGSNRVFQYSGYSNRLVMEDLPTGSVVECIFAGLSRLWICGHLPDGRGMVFWYQNGQYGVGTYLPTTTGLTRSVAGGAADIDHVVFADSRYGSTRHNAAMGGWSHYLEMDPPGDGLPSGTTIPYKGLVIGAGHTLIVLATGSGSTWGIYASDPARVCEQGTITGSQVDLAMPGHDKRWSVISVGSFPIRTGEKVTVSASLDGARTFTTLGYHSLPNATGSTFALDDDLPESATIAYRLIIEPASGRTQSPEVTSVVLRGYPVVTSGRRFVFTLKADDVTAVRHKDERYGPAELLTRFTGIAKSGTPVILTNPITGEVIRCRANPYTLLAKLDPDSGVTMGIQVTLDEVEL